LIYLALMVAGASAFSVTMGAHRLYTHRTFKCNDWVKALLVFGQTVAGQVSLYNTILLQFRIFEEFCRLFALILFLLSTFCCCSSELLVCLDQRSPTASQVQRHGSRPAQRVAWFLFLAHWMVDGAQTSGSHCKRQKD